MNKKEQGVSCFKNGFNCCQGVLSAFQEELDLEKDILFKIGTGFGGGMRTGEVCGAVAGAIMVLSLKYGHYIEGDTESKEKTYSLTAEFQERFKEIHGTIICKSLLGYDVTKEEDMKVLREKGLFYEVCPRFIEDAITILEDII